MCAELSAFALALVLYTTIIDSVCGWELLYKDLQEARTRLRIFPNRPTKVFERNFLSLLFYLIEIFCQ